MTTVQIEARGLTKRFGERTAVNDVSFVAHKGEILGLLGPNGAGKTTTIRLLSTVLPPTTGEFSVAGVPGTHRTEIRRQVGVLPESIGYPGHQTGAEYLRYFARLFGLSRADAGRTVRQLLSDVGLEDRASSRISTYSRGMRQRLGLARALVNAPAVVFLDEPTLGLDPAGQRHLLSTVRETAERRGATVVLSTHTLSEVEEVCTNVLILQGGTVLAAGTVGDVVRSVTVQRHGTLRVPIERAGRAREALATVPGLAVEPADDRPDVFRITLRERRDPRTGRADAGMNAALRAVLTADVPVLSFDVEGTRLSDAFFAMTGEVHR
jgi:ABC-2 type transport system ATP-binding protein